MPLSKDVLGQARYDAAQPFMNKTNVELVADYGSVENARLQAYKADSAAIINHFKNNSLLSIPATPMVAGPYSVTGVSITGTIE